MSVYDIISEAKNNSKDFIEISIKDPLFNDITDDVKRNLISHGYIVKHINIGVKKYLLISWKDISFTKKIFFTIIKITECTLAIALIIAMFAFILFSFYKISIYFRNKKSLEELCNNGCISLCYETKFAQEKCALGDFKYCEYNLLRSKCYHAGDKAVCNFIMENYANKSFKEVCE